MQDFLRGGLRKLSVAVLALSFATVALPVQAQRHDDFSRGARDGGRGGNYNGRGHGYDNDRHYDDDRGRNQGGIGPGKGAAIGAAGGAVLGGIFGGGLKGALIGGGLGAGVGAIAGKSNQDSKRRHTTTDDLTKAGAAINPATMVGKL